LLLLVAFPSASQSCIIKKKKKKKVNADPFLPYQDLIEIRPDPFCSKLPIWVAVTPKASEIVFEPKNLTPK
jgi:hypothetical protein